jgi:hypothetical protein
MLILAPKLKMPALSLPKLLTLPAGVQWLGGI